MANRSSKAGDLAPRTTHIFIVGMPRTGSTLTRGIVNASRSARLGGESRFLPEPTHLGLRQRDGYREQFHKVGDLKSDDGLIRIVDHIFRLRAKSFWSRLAANTDRKTFEDQLRASERTDRALLDVAMAQYAQGRPIRGEKTPHHVHHAPTLLKWYPGARIVHTFRDPRAVYVSLRRKERVEKLSAFGQMARRLGSAFEQYAIANFLRSWRRMVTLHHAYSQAYPGRYMLLRFEDLVGNPASTARRLTQFLEIEYEEAMLEQTINNSSFRGMTAGNGINPGAVDRWQRHLSPSNRERFARELQAELREFGYEP